MEVVLLRPDSERIPEVQSLYEDAFPEDEQIPFHRLLTEAEDRRLEAYYQQNKLAGLTYVFIHGGTVYLGYIAVVKELRGNKTGTKILHQLMERYSDYQIVGEIELAEKDSDPSGIKNRRREFYLREGFYPAGLCYRIFGVDYEILINKGSLTKEEWNMLAKAHVGEAIAAKIKYI